MNSEKRSLLNKAIVSAAYTILTSRIELQCKETIKDSHLYGTVWVYNNCMLFIGGGDKNIFKKKILKSAWTTIQ